MYNKKLLLTVLKDLNKAKKPTKKKDINYDATGKGMLNKNYAGKPVRLATDTLYNPTPYRINAKSDNGIEQTLEPYDETTVNFPGANYIDEYPEMKKGGGFSRNLLATNRLFKKNTLFKKNQLIKPNKLFKKKSYKRKTYDPLSMYFQDGGENKTKLNKKEEKEFQKFYSTLPENLQTDDNTYDIRGYWDALGRPQEFDYTQPTEADGYYHGFSINPNTGEYLKSPAHPTFQHAVDEDRKIGYRPIPNVYGRNIATYNESIADPEQQTFLRNTEGPANYIETELTPEEIEQYKKGGYIVEDISIPSLNKFVKGGEENCPKGYMRSYNGKCVPSPISEQAADEEWYRNWYANRVIQDEEGQKLLDNARSKILKRAEKFPETTWYSEPDSSTYGSFEPLTGELRLNSDALDNNPFLKNEVKFHEKGHYLTSPNMLDPETDTVEEVVAHPIQHLRNYEANIVDQALKSRKDVPKEDRDHYDYMKGVGNSQPYTEEISKNLMQLRRLAGFKPDQVITEEDINNLYKKADEKGWTDPNSDFYVEPFINLINYTKDTEQLKTLFNKLAKNEPEQQDNIKAEYAKYGGALNKFIGGGSPCDDGYTYDPKLGCIPLSEENMTEDQKWMVEWYKNRKIDFPEDQPSFKKVVEKVLPAYNPESPMLEQMQSFPVYETMPEEYMQENIGGFPAAGMYDPSGKVPKIYFNPQLTPEQKSDTERHELTNYLMEPVKDKLYPMYNKIVEENIIPFDENWPKEKQDFYDYVIDPEEQNIQSYLNVARKKFNLKADEVITPERLNQMREEAEKKGMLDKDNKNFNQDIYLLFKMAKDDEGLMKWFNLIAKKDSNKDDIQYGKYGGSLHKFIGGGSPCGRGYYRNSKGECVPLDWNLVDVDWDYHIGPQAEGWEYDKNLKEWIKNKSGINVQAKKGKKLSDWILRGGKTRLDQMKDFGKKYSSEFGIGANEPLISTNTTKEGIKRFKSYINNIVSEQNKYYKNEEKERKEYEKARKKAQSSKDLSAGTKFRMEYEEKGWDRFDPTIMKEGYKGQFQEAVDEANKRKEANMGVTNTALELLGGGTYRIVADPLGTAEGVAKTVADVATLPQGLVEGAVNYANTGNFDMGTNVLTGQNYGSGINQTFDVLGAIPGINAISKLSKFTKAGDLVTDLGKGVKSTFQNTGKIDPSVNNVTTINTESTVNSVKNLEDLQAAKVFAEKYGYDFPLNLERIAESNSLTDKTIRGLMNRHNTFARGVSVDWDFLAQRSPEILQELKAKGFNLATEEGSKAAAEYMATHVPSVTTGGGRASLEADVFGKGLDAIYTSNSLPTAEGYTYGKGYTVKVKRPTDFSSSNRQDWISKNNPEYHEPDAYIRLVTLKNAERDKKFLDLQKKYNIGSDVSDAGHVYAIGKQNRQVLNEDKFNIDHIIGRKVTDADLTSPEIKKIMSDYAANVDKYNREVDAVYTEYMQYMTKLNKEKIKKNIEELKRGKRLLKTESDEEYAHYIHLGKPGEKLLDPIQSWKIDLKNWENKSRAHSGVYTKKFSKLENGGAVNHQLGDVINDEDYKKYLEGLGYTFEEL